MVEVVIPTYAEDASRVMRTVEACLAQSVRPDRIWVVDDGSPRPLRLPDGADRAVAVVRLEQNAGISAARNAGFARTTAPYVAFVNVEVLPAVDWLDTCLGVLDKHQAVGACCAPVRPVDPTPLLTRWRMRFQEERYQREPVEGEVRFAVGHATVFRSQALREVGGYYERLRLTHEDANVCDRLREAGWTTYCTQRTHARSLQTDTLRLLAAKELRSRGWALRPPPGPDDFLRVVTLRDALRTEVKHTALHVARNVARGRISFVPVDVAVGITSLRLAARAGGQTSHGGAPR